MVTVFYLYNVRTGDIHHLAFTKYESAIKELKEIGVEFNLGIAEVEFAKRSICYLQKFSRKKGAKEFSSQDIRKLYSCAQELYEESEEYNSIWRELMDYDPKHLESYEPGKMFIQNRLPYLITYKENNGTRFVTYDAYGCCIKHVRVIHN